MAITYQIKEVADRSGLTAATLRYYEEIGLLRPVTRTAAGYRLYDDATLDRLAFIARAKQLGCNLDEIADLTVAWEGGRCRPVQDRLRDVVADKLDRAHNQIAQLIELTTELRAAAASLELHRPDGPCDDECGCVADVADLPTRQIVPLTTKRVVEEPDAAIACTLAPQSMPSRLDEWQSLLRHVSDRQAIDGGLRATFASSVPSEELLRLTTAEQQCCQFFRFTITVDRRGIALEVRAPADALAIVHSLFGSPA